MITSRIRKKCPVCNSFCIRMRARIRSKPLYSCVRCRADFNTPVKVEIGHHDGFIMPVRGFPQ
jgi:hypothetical protein